MPSGPSYRQTEKTQSSPMDTFAHGQGTVAVAGTAVQASTITFQRVGDFAGTDRTDIYQTILIKALPGNTGILYVGGSAVDSTNGLPLSAGESVSIPYDDISDIYIDTDTNGDGFAILAMI